MEKTPSLSLLYQNIFNFQMCQFFTTIFLTISLYLPWKKDLHTVSLVRINFCITFSASSLIFPPDCETRGLEYCRSRRQVSQILACLQKERISMVSLMFEESDMITPSLGPNPRSSVYQIKVLKKEIDQKFCMTFFVWPTLRLACKYSLYMLAIKKVQNRN